MLKTNSSPSPEFAVVTAPYWANTSSNSIVKSLVERADLSAKGELAKLLQLSISYMDANEAFYHGFLMGVLGNMKDALVQSNREGKDGRYDIAVRSLDVNQTPMILELKVSDTYKGLEAACDRALDQIREKGYDSWLPEEGYTQALNHGISFYRKQCRIKVARRKF